MQGSEVQELGQLLREARERKGVTLADAQQATKIRLSFLQALEKEDFSVLPPPFYIRGFIKTYAVYLNLEPRSTVQLFDDMLENTQSNRLSEQQMPPSADSGGQTALIPLEGLSQGEADLVVNSNERLNLQALPPANPPTLVSGQRRSTGFIQSFESNPMEGPGAGGYSSRKLNSLGQNDKYVLKSVMLPTARGAFYMPNFVPTILVVIIVLAAALLIYRGISNQPKDNTPALLDAVTATVAAGGYPGPYAITPDPSLVSIRATQTAGDAGSIMKAPAYFTPDASVKALDRVGTTGANATPATGNRTTAADTAATTPAPPAQAAAPAPAPAPTAPPPAPTATPTPPPSPTPVPDPINVVVTISDVDPKGSWIRITVDDKVQVEKVGAPNETFTFQGRKVAVRAGNPGVIKVSVDGVDKPYTTPQSGVITHTWFAGGKDLIEK
jgi:cytoskeletal protein RodZ